MLSTPLTYPPDFTFPQEKVVTAQVAAKKIAGLVSGHGAVVQAGGCVGLWPLALSLYFDNVYTCEPAPENYTYLRANVSSMSNIAAYLCALGERCGRVGLTRPKPKAGLWRVDGGGDVQMMPLDGLFGHMGAIDAIVLDVEGYEVNAWKGAERIIATHKPLLWFEYQNNPAEIDAFLLAHGYGSAQKGLGLDRYSIHTSRIVH